MLVHRLLNTPLDKHNKLQKFNLYIKDTPTQNLFNSKPIIIINTKYYYKQNQK